MVTSRAAFFCREADLEMGQMRFYTLPLCFCVLLASALPPTCSCFVFCTQDLGNMYKPCSQGRRRLYPIFYFFYAAWCVWTPESFFTQIQLCGSVVGVLRGPPGRHCRGMRGFAPCAFPASSPTRFGLLVAIKPHTSGGFAGLRVPWGEGIAGPPPGGF
jgi:hypothetical protein